ncbi:MAG: TfoX/Sxy family DNA transformation protein [Gammaproteobacteria bacterium]|nr:TfoX/Sxy family DNA transformation protein [Gammaproteobacteria bacterium]
MAEDLSKFAKRIGHVRYFVFTRPNVNDQYSDLWSDIIQMRFVSRQLITWLGGHDMQALEDLRNIGPTIAKRLQEIGVLTKDDLKAIGSANAYKRIQANYPENSLSLRHYLYSLEGALQDEEWGSFTDRQKAMLQLKAGV